MLRPPDGFAPRTGLKLSAFRIFLEDQLERWRVRTNGSRSDAQQRNCRRNKYVNPAPRAALHRKYTPSSRILAAATDERRVVRAKRSARGSGIDRD